MICLAIYYMLPKIFCLVFHLLSINRALSGVDKLIALIDSSDNHAFPTSLIEQHLTATAHHVATISPKERTKHRDLDCDGIIDTIDAVERSCAAYRYDLLRAFVPDLSEIFSNHSALMSNLSFTNKTIFGDPMAINGDEVAFYGLSRFIEVQRRILYGGLIPGNGPNNGEMINWRGLAPHVGRIARVARNLSNYTTAILDTEWTNLMRVVTALSNYIENYSVDAYVDGLDAAMADGLETQQDMIHHFQEASTLSVALANSYMQNISVRSNDFQSSYVPKYTKLKAQLKQLAEKQTADMEKANTKLESVSDYLGIDAPMKFGQVVSTFASTGLTKLQDFRETYNRVLRERMDMLNDKWKALVSVFRIDNGDNIVYQKKSLDQSENDRSKKLEKQFKEYKQNATNVVASMRLDDAQDLAIITDTTNNMTNTILDATFSSQDSIDHVDDKAKKLRERVADNTKDLRGNMDNLLQELADGTSNQQAKISEFLKMAADSHANELASLVASAANMRLSLTDDQTAAQAAVDSLIAHLQSKLATKAKEERNVSYQVQSALQVGREVSFTKLKAAKDSLNSDNENAVNSMDDAAGSVLEWVQDASAASDKYAKIHRNFIDFLTRSSDTVSDRASVTEAQASFALSKLIDLANGSTRGSSRSASDAAAAARSLLSTLQQVRSGSISVSQVSMLRDGSLRDKLSKIASQLGMNDDAVGDMFKNLVDSVSSDANSQISNILSKQLTTAKGKASKLRSRIDSSGGNLEDLNQETQMTDERAVQLDADFKSQLHKISSDLDRSFSSATERDMVVRREVGRGLEQTRESLLNQARKAVNAVTDSRQSLVASVTDQADNDISSFRFKVEKLAKSQFDKVGSAFETISKSSTDRRRLANSLTRESDYFTQFLQGAWKSALSKHDLVDQVDRMFTEFSQPSNSTTMNMSSDISSLDNSKRVLLAMEKSLSSRLDKSMKVIQDTFLLSEKQMAEKAKMLQTLANSSLTDEQRAELEEETTNLAKSHSLMGTYNTIQSQALSEIFSRNSGLLTGSSDTVGSLQDIGNSISNMLNSNDKVNAVIDQGLRASGLDADTMMNQMKAAINGTGTSIEQMITSNNTQNGFSNNITNAQMSSLLGSAKKDSELANQVAKDLANSSAVAISEKQELLAQYAAMLQENQAQISETATRVMSQVNESESNFTDAIKSDQMDQTTQLVLVKNAVQQLLQLWSHYAEQQARKFTRWNSTESQFYDSFTRELASKGSAVFSQYSITGNDFNQTKDLYDDSVKNFTGFLDHVNSVSTNVREALLNLNVSTQHSASQLGERMYQVDVNDKDIDDEGRDSVTELLNTTEKAIAAQLKDIVSSFSVGRKTRSSFVQTQETVSDEYLDSMEAQVEQLENQIYDGNLLNA